MKVQELFIGMKVRHPQYGPGTVTSLNEHSSEIRFGDGLRKVSPEGSDLTPDEPVANLSGLNLPVRELVDQTVASVLDHLGITTPDAVVEELGVRWKAGNVILKPADPALQAKEVPLETFFHKIVMIRNNLRTLEQKINAHPALAESDKIEIQQYISKCYGSMTTFNILFKTEYGQFKSKG
jgi:hypothetical protein